ncbi:protein-disulfide reductase DsbD [Burkholderia cepacia]|uniref:Protein-disulfide reductase DsbD n=1 Tax=Burkholderia cepacia TaxID=292 RepID=A0AAX2RS91_BURCE|nr:protein-disulfide reductase DsbD [Burkholderia cepacia]TES60904.1 protein-disulfide reductase DsbD [Burkholderia cepacia]TET01604.1 protein-disulfide reductase DsbD [Burkholderia cepacia]TEU47617.1 protein-disulfide reductase DsbD [Burkholderia cepacia]TEU53489.1 protein-disulfide reductase DsbD [Burkholderia cepacia]TEV02095.1 protein-disulfide reductase DsbD [Burkholderia cepacia]
MPTTRSLIKACTGEMLHLFRLLLRMSIGLLLALSSVTGHAANEADLLPPERAFPLDVSLVAPQQIDLRFNTRPGYYLYRDRFSLAVDGVPVKPQQMPLGEPKDDPTFGKVMVYHQPVDIRVSLPHTTAATVVLSVTSQGCADVGVCYPPLTRQFRIAATGAVSPVETGDTASITGQTANATDGGSPSMPTVLGVPLRPANGISWFEFGGFLLAGLLMAGTVCMYPLIPIVTSIISGRQATTLWRGFGLSFAYVQGLALTYAAAGTFAALAGIPLVALTQRPWVLATFGLLLALMALGMFGFFRFQLPTRWQSHVAAWSNRLPGGQIGPVFAMGALSAMIVGPCSTPVLAGALLYIANSQDVIGGALALYAMGVGIGLPLIAVGTFGAHVLPRSGTWMVAVRNALGVLLLVAALWFVYSLLPVWLLMSLVALLLVSCAMMLRAFDPLPHDAPGILRVGKALGVLLVVAGVAEFIGVASGNFDLVAPLGGIAQTSSSKHAESSVTFQPVHSNAELDEALASAKGQPVMVDFYADWCITCKELERFTFTDPRVTAEFARWKLLRIDVTHNTAEDTAMLRRFGLFGPPALIFYDTSGRQQPDAQLAGFVGADRFLSHLKRWGA